MAPALILVDIQNDFLPSGALPVPHGDEVVPVANRVMPAFSLVVATQDWHPRDHGSFAANHAGKQPGDVIQLHGLSQILWPVHCVQNSAGAEFAAGLQSHLISAVFPKGIDPTIDSYSGFFDNQQRRSTGLADYLAQHQVSEVYIVGLATDYCVKFTALDARRLGLKTTLIEDGCRGVNMQPDDVASAIREMRDAGVAIVSSEQIRLKAEG